MVIFTVNDASRDHSFFCQLPEEVVGMADGSKITDEERAVISRTVELKRRSLVSRAAVTATAAAVAPLDPCEFIFFWKGVPRYSPFGTRSVLFILNSI